MDIHHRIGREYCDDTALQRWEGEGGCVGWAPSRYGEHAAQQDASASGARPACATSAPSETMLPATAAAPPAAVFALAPFSRKPFSLPRAMRRNRSNRRERRLPAAAGV